MVSEIVVNHNTLLVLFEIMNICRASWNTYNTPTEINAPNVCYFNHNMKVLPQAKSILSKK